MNSSAQPTDVTPGAYIGPVTGRTIVPGAVIGYRKDGRPIPVVAGGDGTGGEAAGGGDGGSSSGGQASSGGTESSSSTSGGTSSGAGEATAAGSTGPASTQTAADGTRSVERQSTTDGGASTQATQSGAAGQAPANADDWKVENLPPGAQKLIAELRKESGDRRNESKRERESRQETEKKLEGFLHGFAKTLGYEVEGTEEQTAPDPAELHAQMEQAYASYQQAQVELAVFKAAGKHGADPDALLDSRGFLKHVLDLDPDEDGFGDQVTEAIQTAIKANPKLKAAAVTAAASSAPSGGAFAGGPSGRDSAESWSVDDFRQRARDRRRPARSAKE